MSVLREPAATPSRVRGIYRYLLQAKGQKENRELLSKIISPDELVKNRATPRDMFNSCLQECLKCALLVQEKNYESDDIAINPDLPQEARDKKTGDELLPDTLAELFFASDNQDEYDFGLVCAWFLSQDVYDPPGTWEAVQQKIAAQKVGGLLALSNDTRHGQMDDWMGYMGLLWGHALGGKRVLVPDPTCYIKRNLKHLFTYPEEKLSLREFITNLGKRCPLFETGHFREKIEDNIGRRQPNYLSTSTAFALFRLRDQKSIRLIRESDADLMILPKHDNQVDDDGRVSHIIYGG